MHFLTPALGVIGNYDKCGFASSGTGSFRANEMAKPFRGEKERSILKRRSAFETILFSHIKDKVIKALLAAHLMKR